MAGIPGGYEDQLDDEFDFDYEETDDYDYSKDNDDIIPQTTTTQFNHLDQEKKKENLAKMKEKHSIESEDIKTAIMQNNIEFVKKCLDEGFKTESLMHSGWTALMYASTNGCSEIVKFLISKGANVNFEEDLFTPLMAACYSTSTNEEELLTCVKYLIDNGAKMNAHDRSLMTPLMYASSHGFSKLVNYLCEKEVNVNKQDDRGWTALHFGASKGCTHVVRILLQNNADSHLTTFDGQQPNDIAFEKGFSMLTEMMENYNSNNQYEHIPDKLVSLKQTGDSSYVLYDELELFLHGLELGHITKNFKEHHLKFTDLLKIQDSELIEIGIKELGIRKKLIQAVRDVHTNQWDTTSLKTNPEINKLTTLETTAVIANIAKHLSCITSSVQYVYNHIEAKKKILASDDCSHQKMLIEQLKESTRITNVLQKEVLKLNKQAMQVFPNYNDKAVNLIEDEEKKISTRKLSKTVFVLTSGLVLSIVVGMHYGFARLKSEIS